MNDEKRLLYSLASRLLDYPAKDFLDRDSRLEKAAESMPEGSRQVVLDLLAYLEKSPLLALQEEYTRTFDLNPSLCLNLTFHKWGKTRNEVLLSWN